MRRGGRGNPGTEFAKTGRDGDCRKFKMWNNTKQGNLLKSLGIGEFSSCSSILFPLVLRPSPTYRRSDQPRLLLLFLFLLLLSPLDVQHAMRLLLLLLLLSPFHLDPSKKKVWLESISTNGLCL